MLRRIYCRLGTGGRNRKWKIRDRRNGPFVGPARRSK